MSNHFEVRLITEVTKDYTVAHVVVVNVAQWIETPSLKQNTEEKEIFRDGFANENAVEKATEMYKVLVKIIEKMNNFWMSYPEMLRDWLPK
jgi:hypothetical protein